MKILSEGQQKIQSFLKDLFEKLGFREKDLKTVYFNVDTEYESYQTEIRAGSEDLKVISIITI